MIDKLILIGGQNVDPKFYNEENHASEDPCCRRGEFAPQLPCRGVYARSCQKATALAAATLSESTPQAIGMRTV